MLETLAMRNSYDEWPAKSAQLTLTEALDSRVRLSTVAAKVVRQCGPLWQKLLMSMLTELANDHEQGFPHIPNPYQPDLRCFAAYSSKIRSRYGITVVYSVRPTGIRVDWFEFDPTPPRGRGPGAPALRAASLLQILTVIPALILGRRRETVVGRVVIARNLKLGSLVIADGNHRHSAQYDLLGASRRADVAMDDGGCSIGIGNTATLGALRRGGFTLGDGGCAITVGNKATFGASRRASVAMDDGGCAIGIGNTATLGALRRGGFTLGDGGCAITVGNKATFGASRRASVAMDDGGCAIGIGNTATLGALRRGGFTLGDGGCAITVGNKATFGASRRASVAMDDGGCAIGVDEKSFGAPRRAGFGGQEILQTVV